MNLNLNSSQIASLQARFSKACKFDDANQPVYEIDHLRDRAINSIWVLVAAMFPDFTTRREAFFWVVDRLIEEGCAKLQQGGRLLLGTKDEQLALLRSAWPANANAATAISFPTVTENISPELGMNMWFFMDACPAGIAWRQTDGSYKPAD